MPKASVIRHIEQEKQKLIDFVCVACFLSFQLLQRQGRDKQRHLTQQLSFLYWFAQLVLIEKSGWQAHNPFFTMNWYESINTNPNNQVNLYINWKHKPL